MGPLTHSHTHTRTHSDTQTLIHAHTQTLTHSTCVLLQGLDAHDPEVADGASGFDVKAQCPGFGLRDQDSGSRLRVDGAGLEV